jgi:hypothetical protein
MRFEYHLTGLGWCEARLQVGSSWVGLTASYLDDALGDLVRGVLALARGAHQVHVSWAEEPGEFRWVLTQEGASVDVRILWFDELWGSAEDDRGRERLRASCPTRSLCLAVAQGAQAVLDEHGIAGYKERWIEHDFPAEALKELRHMIAAE